MADTLTPLLRALVNLVPAERRDEAFALVGRWLADNAPYRGRRRGRSSGIRKAGALTKLCKFTDAPLSEAPDGETEAEARVRIINDTIERCRLFDRAGMKFKTVDGWDDATMLRRGLERDLIDARIDVRSERGDY